MIGRAIIAMACCCLLAGDLDAQGQRPTATPTPRLPLSPYLNQLRGLNPAVNYFFGVAGQTQRRPVELGRPVATTADHATYRPFMPDTSWDPTITGHGVQFLNCAPYFSLGHPMGTKGNVRRPPDR
jgi:hypothetical protein